MLGVIIGVGSVILINAVGAGAQSLIVNEVKSIGTDLIGILPGKTDEGGTPAAAMGIVITTLTYEDALALKNKNNVPHVTEISAYSNTVANLSWQGNERINNITGTTTGHLEIMKGEIEEGRFFTEDEEVNLARKIVLGNTVKTELFGASEAVGQKIKVKKHSFEVIGVLKKQGQVGLRNFDEEVFMPIKTVQKILLGVNHVGLIHAKVDDEANLEQAMNDIRMTLRDRHDIKDQTGKDDDFTVQSSAQALEIITSITDALRYFLATMAGLSLIIGGIGIMNIMLVSVNERTNEIGLRKALGANNHSILIQFLLESVTITVFGGILGILGGSLCAIFISIVVNFLGYNWDLVISLGSVLVAVGVSSLIGLIFGIYPAKKASKLEPITALQYE